MSIGDTRNSAFDRGATVPFLDHRQSHPHLATDDPCWNRFPLVVLGEGKLNDPRCRITGVLPNRAATVGLTSVVHPLGVGLSLTAVLRPKDECLA